MYNYIIGCYQKNTTKLLVLRKKLQNTLEYYLDFLEKSGLAAPTPPSAKSDKSALSAIQTEKTQTKYGEVRKKSRNQRYECAWQNARIACCMIPRLDSK